jgi:hypothetical protein
MNTFGIDDEYLAHDESVVEPTQHPLSPTQVQPNVAAPSAHPSLTTLERTLHTAVVLGKTVSDVAWLLSLA